MTILEGLPAGTILREKYRVERTLGAGGMGVVLLATQLRVERKVAIKVLRPEMRDRAEVVRRFAREARAASRLRGEHAVRVLDVDDSESGDPFLVMEYLEGRDLLRVIDEERSLSVTRAVVYLLQACEGLAEAHAAGIVHRDLKPANLFLTRRPDGAELLKILDFGISKAMDPVQEGAEGASPADDKSARMGGGDLLVTHAASAIGSPSYMSPEQQKNAASVDHRTDIWSLGVVLYQLLTCELPFKAETKAALVARIAVDDHVPLRTHRSDVDPDLEAVIARCLAKDPSARFSDVAALAHALARFAERGASTAQRVARVLSAAPPSQEPPSSMSASGTPPPAPAAFTQSIGATPATGGMTASLHGGAAPSIDRTMGTEYGSALGEDRETDRSAPPRRVGRWIAVSLLLLAACISVAAVATSRRSTTPPVPSAVVPAKSADPAPMPMPTTEGSLSATPAVATSSRPTHRGTPAASHDAGSKLPRTPPHATSSTNVHNPLDINFR